MKTILGYLVERDGRTLFLRELVEWALEDPEYKVTPLVAKGVADAYDQFVTDATPDALLRSDDTQERIKLMNDLFTLQDQEIALLKQRLEAFVEVVEGIAELTEVVSHSSVECRSKLIIIGDSCKKILAPQE
jgi:hypothetical protein